MRYRLSNSKAFIYHKSLVSAYGEFIQTSQDKIVSYIFPEFGLQKLVHVFWVELLVDQDDLGAVTDHDEAGLVWLVAVHNVSETLKQ